MRAGKASETAFAVARAFFTATRDPGHARIAPPQAGQWTRRLLEASFPSFRRQARLGDQDWFRRIVYSAERRLVPGFFRHMVVRRRAVYEAVTTALSAGAVQVVVLGAGFDVLALLLGPDHPDVSFFEVDHPATQAKKRLGLEAMEVRFPNHHLIPIDFSIETLEALKKHERYRSRAPSVWVAEAVLMYLEERDAAGVFRAFHEHTQPGSRLVFTYLPSLELTTWLGRLMRRRLKRLGESFRWALPTAELGAFVEELGVSLVDAPSPEELHSRYTSESSVGGMMDVEGIGVVENR